MSQLSRTERLDRLPFTRRHGKLLAASGVGWAGIGHWKRGSFLIGASFVVATLLRAFLPDRWVGLLGVRRRLVDVACLGLLGVGIWALTLVVPPLP